MSETTITTRPPLIAAQREALTRLSYRAPHGGLEAVLHAARAVACAPCWPERAAPIEDLRRALLALDEPGNLATRDEVEAAREWKGMDGVDVDGYGAALVSHADDGFWVSGWVWVEQAPADQDTGTEED